MVIYIGIDPGVSGAIAFETDFSCGVLDIPTRREEVKGKKNKSGNPRTRNVYDLISIAAILQQILPDSPGWDVWAYCENTNAHPDQAVTAIWAQAQGIMLWPAMLAGMRTICTLVHPQRWKKELGLLKTDKEASLVLARELYPDLRDRLKFKKDHNRAEALLIMEFGKRVRSDSS